LSDKVTTIAGPHGSVIYIQYDEDVADSGELQAVSNIDDIVARTEQFTKGLINTVQSCTEVVLDAVKAGTEKVKPSKIQLEFGVQLGGEKGIPFVAKGTAQANIKINIEWDLSK
jgi:hypothetical protein